MKEKVVESLHNEKVVVYVASHIRFIDYWHRVRESGIEISSSWIDSPASRNDNNAISKLWINCFEEIRQADMVMIKAEKEDKFKGVLVEIGAALVLGKPVYLVGENNNLGDIYHHPLFYKVSSPEEAITHFAER
jgi:hypothetical protein